MALIVPNSNCVKLKVKALFSMYKVFPLKSKSSEKRVICYYRAKGPFAPGLADRLKCMVSGFVISKESNRNYYIYHDQGFLLEDYLVPASVNRSINYDDISLGVLSCKRLWFGNRIVKLDDNIAAYHFLNGGDIVEKPRIVKRRVRGQKKLTKWQERWNKAIAKRRCSIEHIFGAIKHFGGDIVRSIGLARCRIRHGLVFMLYNMKRFCFLSRTGQLCPDAK